MDLFLDICKEGAKVAKTKLFRHSIFITIEKVNLYLFNILKIGHNSMKPTGIEHEYIILQMKVIPLDNPAYNTIKTEIKCAKKQDPFHAYRMKSCFCPLHDITVRCNKCGFVSSDVHTEYQAAMWGTIAHNKALCVIQCDWSNSNILCT